jgi:predicted  nucleic acid-binding Zn-ribbon protein
LGLFVLEEEPMDRAANLYELQRLDNEEEKVRDRLAEVEASLGEPTTLKQARQKVQKTAETIRRWNTRQHDLELQTSDLKQKISDSERQLYSGNIRNPKELSDRQAEVASLKRRLEQTEEKLLEAMIEREGAEAAHEQARDRLQEVESSWEAAQKDLLTEQAELRARLAEIGEAREALLPSIAADDRKTYRQLRGTKGPSAVVLVQGQTCTGCWMEIPQALLRRDTRGGLRFCENCGRILLLEDDR